MRPIPHCPGKPTVLRDREGFRCPGGASSPALTGIPPRTPGTPCRGQCHARGSAMPGAVPGTWHWPRRGSRRAQQRLRNSGSGSASGAAYLYPKCSARYETRSSGSGAGPGRSRARAGGGLGANGRGVPHGTGRKPGSGSGSAHQHSPEKLAQPRSHCPSPWGRRERGSASRMLRALS